MNYIPPERPRSTFLRDLVLLLGIPAVLVTWLVYWAQPWKHMGRVSQFSTYEVPRDQHIMDVVAGRWDWEDAKAFCTENPHTISFSEDRTTMHIVFDKSWTDERGETHKEAVYDLEGMSGRQIRGAMRGEVRRTEDGSLVVWDLTLTGPDTYAWHRTDWPYGALTKAVRRCPDPD